MVDIENTLHEIAELNANKSEQQLKDIKHNEEITAQLQTQEVIVRSISSLVDYLDNRVSKTAVVNQLKEIGTPDAYRVVEAVNALTTVVEGKETDLTEVTNLLRSAVKELQQVPKSHGDIKIPEPIDNTRQLKALETVMKAVDKSVKAQKLVAEAPIVNVPEAVVNVDAPDLSKITSEQQKTRTELKKALKELVFPATDLTKLEKESKAHTKLLKEIRDKPVGGGGGGGGRATPYEDSNATPAFVTLNDDGSVPVDSDPLAKYKIADVDDSSDPKYYGFTRADGAWYILKEDTTSSPKTYRYVKGASSYDFSNRASETYDYFHEVF